MQEILQQKNIATSNTGGSQFLFLGLVPMQYNGRSKRPVELGEKEK